MISDPHQQAKHLLELDRQHLWHPYSNALPDNPLFPVKSARGCTLTLTDGREIIDGMASWWSTIHGYNHPVLNNAIEHQLKDMAHVMFGGLTHEPAITLAQQLVKITPEKLNRVFLADSGSVSVEVALKMAQQFWIAKGQPNKHKFLAFEGAYHGDTFGAMSVCDPHNGMHHLFAKRVAENIFAPPPSPGFGGTFEPHHIAFVEAQLQANANSIAAVIIEPIVQGAGGMRVYSADFLTTLHELCQRYDVLLIADEIATGLGRTGKWFACEHANISPDILCLGKALTGGYMTMAATLCTDDIAEVISQSDAGCLMHGPTFMGNPLACATANASIQLLQENRWQQQVQAIEAQLKTELLPLKTHEAVKDARVLGAIGVVELHKPVDMKAIQPFIVEQGVWLRPFGTLLYTMPPFVMSETEVAQVTNAIAATVEYHHSGNN